jgi:hypothetical protein
VYKNRTNPDTANEILNKVVASIETNMSPFNIQFVHNLLEDLRLLQARLFQCVPVQDVYRKYVHGLLLSKNIYAIQHCESIISTSARDRGKFNEFFLASKAVSTGLCYRGSVDGSVDVDRTPVDYVWTRLKNQQLY